MCTHDVVDLNELFKLLNNIKGLFLMSYNNSPHAKQLFKEYRIRTVNTKYTKSTEGGQSRAKKELLISNY